MMLSSSSTESNLSGSRIPCALPDCTSAQLAASIELRYSSIADELTCAR